MAADAELILPGAAPALYLAWAGLWLEVGMFPASGDIHENEERPSRHSWTDRFLVGVAMPAVREQAIQGRRDGAESVTPRLLAEPQLFVDALPLLVQADPSRHRPRGLAGEGVTLEQVSELNDEVRKTWAALVASLPKVEDAKQESVFRSGYDAFQRGDLTSIQRWFAQDAVLTVPGMTPYSGTYRGLPEIVALLAHASDRLGIDSPELTELAPEGDSLLARFTTAVRAGGRSMSVRFHQRFWFNDEGQIVRSVLTFEDEQALNWFFGAP